MPGLALATPELTVAHTQMLAVLMEGLCSCPALAIRLQHAVHLPVVIVFHLCVW
jgi:hypothetical protein